LLVVAVTKLLQAERSHHLLTGVSVYKVGIFCYIRPLIGMNGIIVENIRIISNPIMLPAQHNAKESLLYLYT